jgi:hypothetical protein
VADKEEIKREFMLGLKLLGLTALVSAVLLAIPMGANFVFSEAVTRIAFIFSAVVFVIYLLGLFVFLILSKLLHTVATSIESCAQCGVDIVPTAMPDNLYEFRCDACEITWTRERPADDLHY